MQRILYIQYTNPGSYPPLQHSSHIFAESGWAVRFLGIESEGAAEKLELRPHPNIQEQKWSRYAPGLLQKAHYVGFGIWAAWNILRWQPQWIYASDPLICPIALALSYLPRVHFIYHEHDSPPDNNKPGRTLYERFGLWTRRLLARRAELCILPNEDRCEVFSRSTATRRPVQCVWNCPDLSEVIEIPKPAVNGPLRLYYHGTIVPCRLPFTTLEAMAMAPRGIKLSIVGYEPNGYVGYVERLEQEAKRVGVGSQFHYLGPLPSRRDMLSVCRNSDVGIALMPMRNGDLNESSMAGASNKPFDYLSCGLALLVSDLPEWKKMFVKPGYGLACNPEDPESIAKALRWFAEHPTETRMMGERGRQRILCEWNYQAQFAPVLEAIQRLTIHPLSSRSQTGLPR